MNYKGIAVLVALAISVGLAGCSNPGPGTGLSPDLANALGTQFAQNPELSELDCESSVLVSSGIENDEGAPLGCWSFESTQIVQQDFELAVTGIETAVPVNEWDLYCAATGVGNALSVCNAFFSFSGETSLLRIRFTLIEPTLSDNDSSIGDTGVIVTVSSAEAKDRIASRSEWITGSKN